MSGTPSEEIIILSVPGDSRGEEAMAGILVQRN